MYGYEGKEEGVSHFTFLAGIKRDGDICQRRSAAFELGPGNLRAVGRGESTFERVNAEGTWSGAWRGQ